MINCNCVQDMQCLSTWNRLPSVGVPVTLWMMDERLAAIILFGIIIDVEIFHPLEEMASLSLEDLSSSETNR